MNKRKFDDYLNHELGQLPRDIEPARDLWPGIDHAINNHRLTIPTSVAMAAGIVLAVSLAISGGLYMYRATPVPDTRNMADFIALLQSDHEKTKQALLVEYAGQTPLAPDWEEQMHQLEQAEQAIYQALNEDPENLELLKILRQVQSKQIDLIESVYAPLFTTI
jgi:hypothetical protein